MLKKENIRFNKVLGTLDIIFVAFGAMIGWGWVVSSGDWIQKGGVLGTIFGFIIGGMMIYCVGLIYAELITTFPKCGGAHYFCYKAFGSTISFICTWFAILSYISVVCFEAVSFPTILQYIFPQFLKGYLYTIGDFDIFVTWLIVAVLTAIFITYLNILGTKIAVKFQMILTIMIAIVGLLFLVVSLFNGNIENIYNNLFFGTDLKNRFLGIIKVATLTPFFFFGFDVIPQASEEINIPIKKLGKMMVLSILFAITFYVMIVFAVGFIMSYYDIKLSLLNSSLVTADAMEKAFDSRRMANVLIIGGLCGIITSWNSFLIGGSRAIYAMANSKMLPKIFLKQNSESKTPITALLFIGILSIIAPFLGKKMLIWIVNAGNFACCITYFLISISHIILRKKYVNLKRPYKIKYVKVVEYVAIMMSGFMVVSYIFPGTNCTFSKEEITIILIWLFLGGSFYFVSKKIYKDKFATLYK